MAGSAYSSGGTHTSGGGGGGGGSSRFGQQQHTPGFAQAQRGGSHGHHGTRDPRETRNDTSRSGGGLASGAVPPGSSHASQGRRILVVENFERAPPRTQAALLRLMQGASQGTLVAGNAGAASLSQPTDAYRQNHGSSSKSGGRSSIVVVATRCVPARPYLAGHDTWTLARFAEHMTACVPLSLPFESVAGMRGAPSERSLEHALGLDRTRGLSSLNPGLNPGFRGVGGGQVGSGMGGGRSILDAASIGNGARPRHRYTKHTLSPSKAKVLGDYAHRVHLSQEMALVLQNSVSAARWHPQVDFGPPATAAAVLERTVKLLAVLSGHMFTTPDHLLLGACDTLGHQLELLDDIWEGDEGGRCFRYYRYARLIVHDVVEQCCAVATD